MIVGLRCAVCGTSVEVARPFTWRCPRATPTDRHHVLELVDDGALADTVESTLTFERYGSRLAWWAFARANGMTEPTCLDLTRELAGDFRVTPYARSDFLSRELGLDVWVKDETHDLAGSHKARHLVTILLHLRAAEELGLLAERPPLAIASCGNAALAAATLAHAAKWPIDVYVPTWMDDAFGVLLDQLGATIHRSERRASDPPGDPAMHRFRAAVDAGAVPFSVQGPENAWCLDGGRTLGWEMAGEPPDQVFVQVGGGALASCLGAALGPRSVLRPVQAGGCAPFARAAERAAGMVRPERRWAEVMTPWDHPSSLADGILDDETYDWIGVLHAMRRSGGSPVVTTEADIAKAHRLAHAGGFEASATGSAGLAGLLTARATVPDGARVAVVMSGVQR